MRALTVRQPWASLIVSGAKDVENRTWTTRYRGRLAIHAASRPDRVGIEQHPDIDGPLGVVLGTVELVDIVDDADSIWARADSFHWVLIRPRPFSRPFPARGRLSLWELPAKLEYPR